MKPDRLPTAGNRRDFLRNAALGGILGLVGTLAARSTRQDCINEGICRGCAAYNDCDLPQALSARRVLDAQKKGDP